MAHFCCKYGDPNINRVHIKIEDAITKYLAEENLKGTEILYLKGCKIGVQGAKYLAKRLKDIHVQNVDLECNIIGDEGAEYIANGLKGSEVKYLNLEYNNIGDEGAEHIANVLKSSQVENLNMKSNKITNEGATHFAKGLKGSQVLTLNLGYNQIGDEGAECLANVLKHSLVQNLNLKDNEIGTDGAKFLANGLKDSQVQCLNLKNNNILDLGAIHIFNNLANTCVHSLNLFDNRITHNGAKYIANAIKDTQVTNIILNLNPAFSETEYEICTVLQKNKHNLTKMRDGFKLLVTKDAEDGPLVFQVHTAEEAEKCIDVEKYLSFIKVIHDTPRLVPHIVKDSSIHFAKHEILLFVKNISIQFCEFLSKVLEDDHSKYVNLLEVCEDMHLDYIVKDLLLNRGACTIEASNGDVLYPYVYMLLDRYKQPLLANNQVFKCNKEEIIEYFLQHLELEYAQEAIQLLNNIGKNKRRAL